MSWTKIPPTEEGYYWANYPDFNGLRRNVIVRVFRSKEFKTLEAVMLLSLSEENSYQHFPWTIRSIRGLITKKIQGITENQRILWWTEKIKEAPNFLGNEN